jgi:DNA helicase HerA-like ATPase
MSKADKLKSTLEEGYTFKGESIILGGAMFEKACIPGLQIKIPLNTANRHGLIAGATGTGKTKTVQRLSEGLSEKGVSVLLMDVKGDLSGIAVPGNDHPKIQARHEQIGVPWTPGQFPTEMLSISGEKGVRLRATVSEFGPVLFSKILELNDNQQGAVNIVFKYCDDRGMALLDLKDFRSALNYISNEGKDEVKEYGLLSSASVGVIMRKLLELESQGADQFFGEKSFDVEDLVRKDDNGYGYISVLRLADMQEKPKLFSTFMLCLLAEVYSKFPELGDKAAPKLVIVIDEAHLIFRDATKALMDQLEMVIKLIRSKGVGIFFCTQVPSDVPDIILSQLGAKFQHSMRAFTAKDRKDIKLVAQNYPSTEFYNTETLLTELGIGEAIVTVLNEKGSPTPLAHTMLCAPRSRMDILSPLELDGIISRSKIAAQYNEVIDRESAYELLKKKLENAAPGKEESKKVNGKKEEENSGIGESIQAVTKNPLFKTFARELTRGLLGAIFGTSRRR